MEFIMQMKFMKL